MRDIVFVCVYEAPSCWRTSTYRLRTFRFEAWDRGRPGGGAGGANLDPVGVLGAEPGPPSSEGTRFDRTLIGGLGALSIAEEARGGGGPALGGRIPAEGGPVLGGLAPPGDAVCALDGGGGGVAGLAASSEPD